MYIFLYKICYYNILLSDFFLKNITLIFFCFSLFWLHSWICLSASTGSICTVTIYSMRSRRVVCCTVTPSTVGPELHDASPICMLNQRSNSANSLSKGMKKKRLIQLSLGILWTQTSLSSRMCYSRSNMVHIPLHFTAFFSLWKLMVCFDKLTVCHEVPPDSQF